jgi:hypothetical protein
MSLVSLRSFAAGAVVLALAGCAPVRPGAEARLPAAESARQENFRGSNRAKDALLDEIEERTFRYFWDLADPETGLVPDRWPTVSFASVAATGFGLTAYPIGVERGWASREEARARVLLTLRFLWRAPQGPEPVGRAGYRGFFYHFLDPRTGERFEQVELSSVDTALLVAGVLFCQAYFDRDDEAEREIRDLAERIYARVEWTWMRPRPPRVAMGWTPEEGFHHLDWSGYNEAMIVYLLALGAPVHAVETAAWKTWTETYRVVDFGGESFVSFAPLFGHQYSHIWVDFRGLRDEAMRNLGWDYFENSRRAALAQQAWAVANPLGWLGVDGEVWGVSACDGPVDLMLEVQGKPRRFFTYAGRGVGPGYDVDDGTIAPTAAGGSFPFVPDLAFAALSAMRERYGDHLFSRYGFLDAFNPTFRWTEIPLHHGKVVPGVGWFDTDYLGIDQGPILAMMENHRTGLVWRVMREHPHLRRGLARAGFEGPWLDSPPN